MEKRGQFYIVAAIIIIIAISGFFLIKNYAKTEEKGTKVYDLSKELKIETGYVYDYGIYNQAETENLIENWAETYYNYSKGQEAVEDWIFVYGNEVELTALTFSTVSVGKVGITIGGGEGSEVDIKKEEKKKTPIPKEKIKGKKVEVIFKNSTHEFELKKGENFFFVIKSKGYVSKN